MSRLLSFAITVTMLLNMAGCTGSHINNTGRPLREGEKTARIQIKNVFLSWSACSVVDGVEFSGADGYEGRWGLSYFGGPFNSFYGGGSFYLPVGNFHLEIIMDHPSNWDIRETSNQVTYRFIGFKDIRRIDVEIEEGKEYIISPRGFYSLEAWRNRGRPRKRKNSGEPFEVYP